MMKLVRHGRLVRAALMTSIGASLACVAVPSLAQDSMAEARLRKMEAEIRAIQRTVFPGTDGKVFQPEITQGAVATTVPGQPATGVTTDILARLQTLEAAVARLTGQIEQNGNRIAQIEARLGPATSPSAAVAPISVPASPAASPSPTPTPAPQANLNAMSGGVAAPAATPAATAPSASRVAAVRAIEKPQTGDAGDDEYSYGFRLWEAKFYPEAVQQLKLFVQKYPKHARISFGRNLLGRAYLDDRNPTEAAKWFLQNYQADKSGARAPDSLLYLGVAMKDLKDTKRACIALAEFSETYAAEAAGRLKGTYDATRSGLKCS